MDGRLDHKRWTGDYSTKGHYPLASEEERRVQRRVMRVAAIAVVVLIAALSIWQVFA